MNNIYLDNAATTRMDPRVTDSMLPHMTAEFGNPSATHFYGRQARVAVEKARKKVAELLSAEPGEIFFTSGGTESNNTAILAGIRDMHCGHIITSPIEHHAVLKAAAYYTKKEGLRFNFINLLPGGHVDLDHLETILNKRIERCLVSLMHANNEIGNITDIQKVGELCKKYNAVFHSDCVQTVGHYPINLSDTKVDFISASGHKFHGPKGTGIFYVNKAITVIKPLIFGGSQERNLRAGTENVAGIIGFAKALEISMESCNRDKEYIGTLKETLLKWLQLHFPAAQVNGDTTGQSLYTVLNVSFPQNVYSADLLLNLDIAGICVSGGSACGSASSASHVIEAIRPGNNDITIRFSFSKYNTMNEIEQVTIQLKNILLPSCKKALA